MIPAIWVCVAKVRFEALRFALRDARQLSSTESASFDIVVKVAASPPSPDSERAVVTASWIMTFSRNMCIIFGNDADKKQSKIIVR